MIGWEWQGVSGDGLAANKNCFDNDWWNKPGEGEEILCESCRIIMVRLDEYNHEQKWCALHHM